MQIKRLEEMVGDMLFERGPRGVGLTRKGGELLSNARRIVSLLDETAASMSAPPLDGPVRIGIPEEYGHAILSRALGAFAKRHPQVEITVSYAHSASQMAALRAGELDLAVVFEWQDFSDGEVLMRDPTVWVTSDLHRMHEETPLPIAIYQNSGWCRDFAIRLLEQRGLAYRVAYTSDTSGGLRLAVTSGLADRADLAQQHPGRLPRTYRRRRIRRHRCVERRAAPQSRRFQRGDRRHGRGDPRGVFRQARRLSEACQLSTSKERTKMAKVSGIGGVFFRARDTECASAIVRKASRHSGCLECRLAAGGGPTVFAPFTRKPNISAGPNSSG